MYRLPILALCITAALGDSNDARDAPLITADEVGRICQNSAHCRKQYNSIKSTNPGGYFYEDNVYNTKGCFSKTNEEGVLNYFFGTGGSTVEEAKYELPGVQERVYCTVPADMSAEVSVDVPADTPVVTGARGVEDNAGVFSGPGIYLIASAVALVPCLYL